MIKHKKGKDYVRDYLFRRFNTLLLICLVNYGKELKNVYFVRSLGS